MLSTSFEELCIKAFRTSTEEIIPLVALEEICKKSAIESLSDIDQDSDCAESALFPSSYTKPVQIVGGERFKRHSTIDSAIKKRKKQSTPIKLSSEDLNHSDSYETDIDIMTIDEDDKPNLELSCNFIFPSPSITDLDFDATDSDQFIDKSKKSPKYSPPSALDPITGERKYICTIKGCGKQYKNANGLKYHLTHAHPTGDIPPELISPPRKKEQEGFRPYMCTVEGCQKRYKNLNGLKVFNFYIKYHIEHSHMSLLPPARQNAQTPGQPLVYNNVIPRILSFLVFLNNL